MQLGRHLGVLHHDLVRTVATYDHSGMWAVTGHSTCAGWVADALDVSLGTAREWLRVGHAIARLPEVDASFEAGRLSYAQVRTLTRIAVDHPGRAAELVELAERTPARHLAIALATWTAHNEDAEQLDRRHRSETWLSARTEPDGMGVITLRLPPVEQGAVMVAVDAAVMATTESAECASADASPPRDVTEDGRRSLGQQRAAALVGLVTGGGAGVSTELIIHVRADGATLQDGTPIADTLAERLASESFIRAMIHDAESHPINVSGRHRHPTHRQKLVVTERDRTCTCGATTFLHHHHEPPYEETRHTLVEELELKCGRCHRRRHAEGRSG